MQNQSGCRAPELRQFPLHGGPGSARAGACGEPRPDRHAGPAAPRLGASRRGGHFLLWGGSSFFQSLSNGTLRLEKWKWPGPAALRPGRGPPPCGRAALSWGVSSAPSAPRRGTGLPSQGGALCSRRPGAWEARSGPTAPACLGSERPTLRRSQSSRGGLEGRTGKEPPWPTA